MTDVTHELRGDRPRARDALSAAVREGLFDGARRFTADPAAKVLVLTGAGDAPVAVRAAKRTVRLVAEQPVSAALDAAARLREPVHRGADAREGPAAFREKRTPEWMGS